MNSKYVTEDGPKDMLASEESTDSINEDEIKNKIKLPGVKEADKCSRKIKTEIICKSVKFSPNGRSFTAISTEGILIYSLDSISLFDPFYIDTDVTIENINQLLSDNQIGKALIYALKLNDLNIIENVMESFEIDQSKIKYNSYKLFSWYIYINISNTISWKDITTYCNIYWWSFIKSWVLFKLV